MIFSGQIRAYTGFRHRWRLKGAIKRAAGSLSYRLLIFFVLSMSMHGSSTVVAESLSLFQEYQVKAAFLFNFANFVDWPDKSVQNKETNFVVGVLGENPFGEALDSLQGKSIKGRRVVVQYYANGEDALNCHILFISSSEKGNLPRIVKALKGIPVLTVGDYEGFCQKGGMISLSQVGNRIGFEVNDSVARQAGLKISSQLLKLARKIIE